MSGHLLEALNINDVCHLDKWLKRFKLWCKTNSQVTGTNETAFYLTMIGKDAYTLVSDLSHPVDVETLTVDELHKIITDHLKPTQYEIVERSKFYSIQGSENEPVQNFILRVQQQAAKCDFGGQLETQLCDKLVNGINDSEIQHRLLSEPKLTLESAKLIIQNSSNVQKAVLDTSRLNLGDYNSTILFSKNDYKRSKTPPKYASNRPRNNSSSNKSFNYGQCFSCEENHDRRTCRYRQSTCFNCNGVGHIKKVCKGKRKIGVRFVEKESSPPQDTSIQTSFVVNTDRKSHLVKKFKVKDGSTINLIIDTGSSINLISQTDLGTLKERPEVKKESIIIRGISGQSLETKGSVEIEIQKSHSYVKVKFHIIGQGPSLLGLEGIRKIEFRLEEILSVCDQENQIVELIHKCANNKGGMNIEPISFKNTATPKFFRARPIAYGLKDAVKINLDLLCAEDVLETVSHSEWATPIVVAFKSNGDVRICGDYRISINQNLEQVPCLTMEHEDMFSQTSGSVMFSTIDRKHVFLELPLTEEAKKLTTINTPFGLFRYKRSLFGLNVSPGLFQKEINSILDGLKGVLAYQDDLLVFGSSKQEHDQHLLEVLKRLDKFNVRINSKKSSFQKDSIPYLGYRLTKQGITPDEKRLGSIKEAKRPKNHSEL